MISVAKQHLRLSYGVAGANIIHGNLKMANVVRFAGRMELIDLDASAMVAARNEKHTLNADNYNRSKVSSGIVPPE